MKFKDTITRKISLVALGGLLILSAYFIFSSYVFHLESKEANRLNQLSVIALNVAAQIDGDQYEALINRYKSVDQIKTNDQDPIYQQIQKELSAAHHLHQLNSPIYILSLDEEQNAFYFGAISNETPIFRHSYTSFPKYTIDNYTKGGKLEAYEDEHGEWLSAFQPIKNKAGKTVGIVQADEKVSNFCAYAKPDLYKNLLVSVLVVLFIGLLLQHYLKKVITLVKDKDLAEQKAEIKARFLSTMSHEIRTPMNAVIGLTNIMIEENPRPDQKDNLQTLKFSADMLLALINDVLDYSKIEAGKINFENINFDLHQLINNIGNTMRVHAQRKNLPLLVDVDQWAAQYIMGDPVRLSQILTNLCGNAIKFTEKGEVKISVRSISKSKGQQTIRFAVKDTGIGISQDKFEEIFKSFSQADTATTRKFGGTGLGLSITKKLLELQNSNIQLQSKPGEGSKFHFDLEVSVGQAPVDSTNEKTSTPLEKFHGVKVLLVEDNKINVIVAKKFLSKWGFDIDVAENGKIAFEKAQQNDFDIVLMDLDMPVMDGYQATEAIRNLPEEKYKALPIIALSASAVSDFKDKAIEVGMNEYVTKPFKPHELNEVLSRFIAVTV